MTRVVLVTAALAMSLWWSALDSAGSEPAGTRESYADLVLADQPAAYWRFGESEGVEVRSVVRLPGGEQLVGQGEGSLRLGQPGPRPEGYPLFAGDNSAVRFTGKRGFFRVQDPGDESLLDFDRGDAITIEAWVNPESLAGGQQTYIVGKGRTGNDGVPRENQNYALRLRGMGGTARVSFLFRNSQNRTGAEEDFHRWNSDLGFVIDGAWHHVAVVYAFGRPESVRGYIDGRETGGQWDLGGATDQGPVVDNDELWIGSSLGGSPSSTFHGSIDEVAIYRRALPAERLRQRYLAVMPDPREVEFAAAADLPTDAVSVELHEGLPQEATWSFQLPPPGFRYEQPSFAFVGLPKKYNAQGVIDDRTNPFLVRARAKIGIGPHEAGRYQLLLRAKNAARLFVDGTLVAQTDFMNHNASGHEDVPELAGSQREDLRGLPPGCQEQLVDVELEAGEHVVRVDAVVGGKGLRLELDELCVAAAREGEPFRLLTADGVEPVAMTDLAWYAHASRLQEHLQQIDADTRARADDRWQQYWRQRHELAREVVAARPAVTAAERPAGLPVHNEIDRFVGARLAAAGVQPAELTDDYEFLRRVTLDTVGVVPTREEIAALRQDGRPDRRAGAIDRLLRDPRWADHWVPYWQDVLAENPGILKPKLNNTGPFRWWIYESFLDGKPLDRFVTELVLMEGSEYYGGPAGFAMATQNDVPLAAKAHVLAKAFLGIEMKCARCHDAPYHPFKQRELFSLAAMLHGRPLELPETSTVPLVPGARKPLIEVSLEPGEEIAPEWPFARLAPAELPDELLHDSSPRARLAATLTSPQNERFSQVIVNRLWKRYLGRGLVEPVDDWQPDARASHPELLDFLARELVLSDYDLKHVARLILNSHAYQRRVVAVAPQEAALFATPIRRRMTAEQLVDSLFVAAGKPFSSEVLTLDPEGRRPVDTFLNLGAPRRAWQFTSLSNERDRPALALPVAQSIVDVLVMFGWRDSRPNPVTERDETPTVLQPLMLANGLVGRRAVRMSDDSAITQLCLQDLPLESLIDQVFLQVVSRPPDADEREMFRQLLADGFDTRRRDAAPASRPKAVQRTAVSWSNHLSAEATRIKLELERAAQAGDPPTARLAGDWRERMEDMVWALVNSPEFMFVP